SAAAHRAYDRPGRLVQPGRPPDRLDVGGVAWAHESPASRRDSAALLQGIDPGVGQAVEQLLVGAEPDFWRAAETGRAAPNEATRLVPRARPTIPGYPLAQEPATFCGSQFLSALHGASLAATRVLARSLRNRREFT